MPDDVFFAEVRDEVSLTTSVANCRPAGVGVWQTHSRPEYRTSSPAADIPKSRLRNNLPSRYSVDLRPGLVLSDRVFTAFSRLQPDGDGHCIEVSGCGNPRDHASACSASRQSASTKLRARSDHGSSSLDHRPRPIRFIGPLIRGQNSHSSDTGLEWPPAQQKPYWAGNPLSVTLRRAGQGPPWVESSAFHICVEKKMEV